MIDQYDHRGRLLSEPEDDSDVVERCPCGAALPSAWQEDRRMVGWPDQFHDIEVRPFKVCECGERIEGEGWYE